MPRYRRRTAAGSVQHVISRFVNLHFLFDEPGARAEYLRRAGQVLPRTDWTPLAYALMSSHVHWVLLAGKQPSASFIQPLHVGFAAWLNRTAGRLGPVFAERHHSVTCTGETVAAVLAYVHNNPVRAGVTPDPAESLWTSHRFYLGTEPPPSWLAVEDGLHLSGFGSDRQSRRAFHELVCARQGEPKSSALSATNMHAQRREARAASANPIELRTPQVYANRSSLRLTTEVIVPEACPDRWAWGGDVLDMLAEVARTTGTAAVAMRSRARTHDVSAARRIALLAWRDLARPTVEMTRALGMSASAASNLIRRASIEERQRAAALAAAMARTERQRVWAA